MASPIIHHSLSAYANSGTLGCRPPDSHVTAQDDLIGHGNAQVSPCLMHISLEVSSPGLGFLEQLFFSRLWAPILEILQDTPAQ